MSIRRTVLAVVSGVLAVVLGLAWWHQRQATPGAGEAVETWSASTAPAGGGTAASGTATAPGSGGQTAGSTGTTGQAAAQDTTTSSSQTTAAASSSPVPAGCAATLSPMTPTRFVVPSMQVDSPVLSLGLAKDGSVDTPPFDQPHSVGWYRGGPKPGSRQGKVVLTAHTFHAGGALGNELFDQSTGLKPGALVKVSDAGGRTQCYTVTRIVKVMVKDYDPNSKVLYDPSGDPMLALVICWDWNPSTRFWASRVIFYASPLAR